MLVSIRLPVTNHSSASRNSAFPFNIYKAHSKISTKKCLTIIQQTTFDSRLGIVIPCLGGEDGALCLQGASELVTGESKRAYHPPKTRNGLNSLSSTLIFRLKGKWVFHKSKSDERVMEIKSYKLLARIKSDDHLYRNMVGR